MLLILAKLIVSKYVAESISTDCGTFQTHTLLSTAYVSFKFYAVEKNLHGKNISQSVVIDSATYQLTMKPFNEGSVVLLSLNLTSCTRTDC